MGKATAKQKREPSLFPETEKIAALLSRESAQDIVILAVPSHDRDDHALPESLSSEWASNGMGLFADLYRGATAFRAEYGIFKTDEGQILRDKPFIIESFADVDAIHDVQRLNLLVDFCKRMGKTLNQDSVMVVFGNVRYYLKDYSGV